MGCQDDGLSYEMTFISVTGLCCIVLLRHCRHVFQVHVVLVFLRFRSSVPVQSIVWKDSSPCDLLSVECDVESFYNATQLQTHHRPVK